MGLFFNSDINKLYVGNTEVKEVYLGSQKVWPVGLPVGTTFDFDYTGNVQSVELPKGKYKLQCWGAQGGNVTGTYAVNGSKGGYSEGVLTLTEKTTLYVFVGGQGTSYTSSASQTSTSVVNGGWNGGGAGIRTSRYDSSGTDGRSFPRGGGGATDICTVTSSMSYSNGVTNRSYLSRMSRCIVAGGGAGASARYTVATTSSTSKVTDASNSGTLKYVWDSSYTYASCSAYLEAGTTYYVSYSSSATVYSDTPQWYLNGTRVGMTKNFTPSTSGTYVVDFYFTAESVNMSYTLKVHHDETTTSTSTSKGTSSGAQQGGGTSGKGQYPGKATSAGGGGAFGLGASQSSTNYRYCGGGGGGGWYGGGTSQSDSSTSYVSYSGGGSGFVNTSANASSRPSGYTGLQLDSGTTTAGSSSFESVSGGTETGHSGNGYARITVIE